MVIKFTVRAPDDLMARLRALAQANRRSTHSELLVRLEYGIKAAEAERQEAGHAAAQG